MALYNNIYIYIINVIFVIIDGTSPNDLNKQKIFHLTDNLLQANMTASSGLWGKCLPYNFLCQNVNLYNIIILL